MTHRCRKAWRAGALDSVQGSPYLRDSLLALSQ